MDSAVESALDRAFPDRTVETVGATGPSWNESNRTVRVAFADGDAVYLKCNVEGDPSRLVRERAVLDYVGANCEVSVPRVLGSDAAGDPPYLVTEPADGRSFMRAWSAAGDDGTAESDGTDGPRHDRPALARAVGRALATVHERRFDAHGVVVGGGEDGLELDPDAGSWSEVLVATVEEMRGMAPSSRFDHHFDRVISAVEANRDRLDDAPAALLHGDPAMPNCLLCGCDADAAEPTVGLLDWEVAHVGDPARDLYRARTQQLDSLRDRGPERLVRALHDGYRERAGSLPAGYETRRPVYAAVRHLGNSGYFDRLAEYVDEPRESLADWVDREMDRRLAAIA